MSDGESIFVSKIGAEGSLVQQISISTGQTQDILIIDNLKGGFGSVSPDAKWIGYNEKVFGQPSYGVFLGDVASGVSKLVAALDGVNVSVSGWSKDSIWLLLVASEYTSYDTVVYKHFLVNPDTCEVIYLPLAQGSVSDWK
jgi:Tol biopolymer transport system component